MLAFVALKSLPLSGCGAGTEEAGETQNADRQAIAGEGRCDSNTF